MAMEMAVPSISQTKNEQMAKCLTRRPIVVEGCMSSPVSYDLQGQGGGVVIYGPSSYIGPKKIRWIQLVTDTSFESLVSNNIEGTANLVGFVIPAGVGIGGDFSQIEVTSGTVIAYFA